MSEGFSPQGLYERFAQTKHGKKLAGDIRYGRYKPEGVTNYRWQELLGPDVNNLEHLTHTLDLTEQFIEGLQKHHRGLIDEYESDSLRLAAVIHDWAEAIDGDVSHSEKTDAIEKKELDYFRKYLDEFCPNLTLEEKMRLLEVAEEVVFDQTTKLGMLFNTVELMGYVGTSLRAFSHVEKGTAPDCEEGLNWLVADVISNNHLIVLIERAQVCQPIADFLEGNAQEISRAFESIDPEVLERRGISHERFRTNQAVWKESKFAK